tara:strand:+ start:1607 stop:3301 length:1695 start_codon:yes stop_codon:yes gene_type:complete
MIVKPSDIIYHIVGEELEKGSGVIDTTETNGQTGLGRARANHLDWKMAFTVNKSINSKKLIEGIAKESKLFPFFKGDKLSFNSIQDSYDSDSVDFEIKRDSIISIKFDRTKIDDVRTKVVLHYHYDYARKEYQKSTLNNIESDTAEEFFSTNGYQNSYLGIEGEQGDDPIELDYIRDGGTAEKLQRFLLSWYCNQHNLCSVRLPLKYLYAEVGDIVAFDREVNDNLQYGEGYSLYYRNNVGATVRNGQEILPYFLCTEVKKSLEYVDIKLIQLHSQDDEITNVAPIANAGTDQIAYENDTITLDGTGSFDPDGDTINYVWYSNNGIQLDNIYTPTPSFTVDVETETEYTFDLIVTDSEGVESLPDSCKVTINPIAEISLMVVSEELPQGWEESGFLQNDTGSLRNVLQTGANSWKASFRSGQSGESQINGFVPIYISNPFGVNWYIERPRHFPNYPEPSGFDFYQVAAPAQPLMNPGTSTTSEYAMIEVYFNPYTASRHSADGYLGQNDAEPYPFVTFHTEDGTQFGKISFSQDGNIYGESFPGGDFGGTGLPPGELTEDLDVS